MVTLPTARTMSGMFSAAISNISGSIGTPTALAIGAVFATDVIWLGRLTDASVVIAATATTAATSAT